jgi:hypothetical protein
MKFTFRRRPRPAARLRRPPSGPATSIR